MEDSKKDIYNSITSFFQLPWVKALIAFIIFTVIFCAGAKFGSQYGRSGGHNEFMGGQRGGNFMGQMMGGKNQNQVPVNGAVSGQKQQSDQNKGASGGLNATTPQSQQSGQGQQTQQPVVPSTSAQ